MTEVVPTSMPKTKRPFILFLLDWPFGGDSLFGDCDAMLCVSEKKGNIVLDIKVKCRLIQLSNRLRYRIKMKPYFNRFQVF